MDEISESTTQCQRLFIGFLTPDKPVSLSLFEISEIGHWILFVIWLLQFVISSLVKKLVLECFYRVEQDLTSHVLKR